jgi:hypothetical protein
VATWAGDRSFAVLAANLTDPMMMRGQRRAVSPLDGVRVVLDLDRVGALAGGPVPADRLRVRVLAGGRWADAEAEVTGGTAEVALPPVEELAAVRLTW